MNYSAVSLRNHLLLAMPALRDPIFSKTVTYICEHTQHGAMGLIVNQPLQISLGEILKNMEIECHLAKINTALIYYGGPLQSDRGFVLHSPAGEWQASFSLNEHLSLTTSRDILEAIAQGEGPDQYLVALGYAGWDEGQLEQEIAENAWIWAPASTDMLFEVPWGTRWKTAAHRLGIEIELLSSQVGHA